MFCSSLKRKICQNKMKLFSLENLLKSLDETIKGVKRKKRNIIRASIQINQNFVNFHSTGRGDLFISEKLILALWSIAHSLLIQLMKEKNCCLQVNFFPLSFEKVQYFGLEVPLLGEIEIGTTTKIKNLEKKNYSTAAVTMKIL